MCAAKSEILLAVQLAQAVLFMGAVPRSLPSEMRALPWSEIPWLLLVYSVCQVTVPLCNPNNEHPS